MKYLCGFLLVCAIILSASRSGAETLHLVTSLDPLEAAEYIEAFENDTNVQVQWIRLSAGEALARLRAESSNPTQDVWFGAPITEFITAKNADLLAKFKMAPEISAIPEKWRDPERYWAGIYFGAITFICGKDSSCPASWKDLLEPQYKGGIVLSYPYTAGTGYTILAGLNSLMGEDGALEYYKKLDAQTERYTKAGSTPVIDVGIGEAKIGIVFDQDAMRKGVSRGFAIRMSYPSDGVPYEIGGVAAINGGNVALAGKFIEWATSLKAQNLMHKWFRVPLNPRAIVNEKNKRPEELNLVKMDFIKSGRDREEIIKRWRERIGK